MESVDWDELQKKVSEIKSNTVSARSRAVYQNSYGRFIAWVFLNKTHLVVPAFAEKLGSISGLSLQQIRKRLRPLLDRDQSNPPLQFDAIEMNVFGAWLLTLQKADGSNLSFSAINTHRAGLFNLYRDYGHEMSPVMEKEMRQYFKGLKREMASAAARGEARVKTGKDPLSFELYRYLCERLLQCSSKDMMFARTYIIIAWNLMCRSANAFSIRYIHIEWSGDALCVYFAHQKNDQEGNRPRDPRHIYANPLKPELCPVLAIATFWATSSFIGDDRLFPGSNQYERFWKCLQRLLESEDVAHELRRRGVHKDELGTHSMRKGAATYCASGSTACPSSTSVHLRAGWSLGGVQNTYLRYESAGDMHVGRTVSGLPPDSHEFAMLPPHFGNRDADVEAAIECVFPELPTNLTYVGEFCLASLVYHAPYLRTHLDPNHPLFETPLFQHPSLIADLSRKVTCNGNRLQATGIPPHVAILEKMKSLLDANLKTMERVDATRVATVTDIMRELENRAIGAGTVTFDGLDAALKRCLDTAGVTELISKLNVAPGDASVVPEIPPGQPSTPCFFWDGRFRRVPADFKLCECSVEKLWVLWQCGNTSKNIPPLRVLDGRDMPTRNLQKRLSDVRYLMSIVEDRSKRTGVYGVHQTVEDAVKTFSACADSVDVPPRTSTARKRRRGQLSWTTVVALNRKSRKCSSDS
ncbi:hypothetical protein F444_19805 [Phytophthora nicotianae P1976]|uniref:Uncharacterized protein n=1 Tax=Phytophthora nicotianae P1976 TaxID=1317066 RepID=A0A080Z6M0_PHYNI|nr:hypothetical protein F444_19805 [Phytophthora nicotianae P1976]